MIVKERQLVAINTLGASLWIGDTKLVIAQKYPMEDGYLKVKHQLVCTDCHLAVRPQDDHHCSDPD